MSFNGFKLLAEVEPSYCPSAKLFKWVAPRSGLQVVLIQRQSPSVSGYFTVATEANDNSGCPHTLEHVVFMGSKQYPYKGLLDILGAKQLSATNAWTAQDHTCYTLETAGFEGFANLLPVYLDHILNATVNESACVTEVYHVDAKGEEKGVVFSEMQGHEHNSENLISAEVKRLLYASGSGYSTDTGGKLDALRVLDWNTIKDYHTEKYHAANLSVVVCGDMLPEELLNVLSPFEASLPDKVSTSRPFIESPLTNALSPLNSTTVRRIEFPDSSETAGEICIAWLGPQVRDTLNSTALQIISSYLSSEGSGKLNAKFINVSDEEALASSAGSDLTEYLKGQFEIWFYGVPTEKLEEAGSTLLSYFENDLLQELDFGFLQQCIDRTYDTFVMSAEEDWETFIDVAITEFVYGNAHDGKIFDEWFASTAEFDELRSWSKKDWQLFIKKWVADAAKVCVLGKPSKSMHKKIEQDKKRRLKSIKQTINLDNAGKTLQDAISVNERPIPEHMLDLFPTPDFGKIRFISSQTGATPRLIDNLTGHPLRVDSAVQQKLTENIDLAINFESVRSQFVTIKVYIVPQAVDRRLLPLIDVLLSNVFAMPMVLEDGQKLSGVEVAQVVDSELLDKSLGRDYELQEVVLFEVKAKASNYAKAIKWIERAMFQFDADNMHCGLFIAQHLKALAVEKRSESALLKSAMNSTMLSDDSLRKRSDSILTESQIRDFAANLEQTVADVKLLSQQLYRKENMRILVIADVLKLENPLASWKELDLRLPSGTGLCQVPLTSSFLNEVGIRPAKKCVITLCAASDSSNITIVAPGPSKYGHEDLPSLALVNACLEMTEGPFWRAVRGPGYAYGAFVRTSVQLGKVVLSISSAADVLSSIHACRNVVEDIASGKEQVDDKVLANGVSVIVSELASYLGQVPIAVKEKFMDTVMKGYEPDYVYSIMEKIQRVTKEEFVDALRHYLLPLFDPMSSMVFMVVPPSDQEALTSTMERLGYEVEVREVEVDSDSEEDDEEEDDEEDDNDEEDDSDSGSDHSSETASEDESESDSNE